jgi:hypothetical protein
VVWERYRHYKRILGVADADIDALKTVNLERNVLTEEGFDAAYGELVERYIASLGREAYRKETTVGGVMEFAGNVVADVFGGKLGETLPLNKNEDAELNIYLPSSDTFATASTILRVAGGYPGLDSPVRCTRHAWVSVQQPVSAVSNCPTRLKKAPHTPRKSRMPSSRALIGRHGWPATTAGPRTMCSRPIWPPASWSSTAGQIVSSLLREQILKREYDNHLAHIEDIEAQGAFLNDKFTNEELYGWMQGELSKTYYDCYKLAFDLAKRAEQTLKHELTRPELDGLNPIKFGYWDSGRKGLLAGETLFLDLHRPGDGVPGAQPSGIRDDAPCLPGADSTRWRCSA